MTPWSHILTCLQTSDACALVTVAHVAGSTPREPGARMVVRPDGGFFGTIGGGTLELEAIRLAASAARSGVESLSVKTVSLGPDLGQCCGGRVDFAIEVLTKVSLADIENFAAHEAKSDLLAVETFYESGAGPVRRLVETRQSAAFSVSAAQDGGQRVVALFGRPRLPIYLFGAGHVGKALIMALAPHPFHITWIDSRKDEFPARVPANVTMVCSSDIAPVLNAAPDGAFIIAMTHSHALDEDIMARALLEQKFAYCGVIGSKTKRARFKKRLSARGLSDPLVSQMICPIGTGKIRSKHPAAIAAGVVVDLLERYEAQQLGTSLNFEAEDGLAQIIPHGQ